MKKLPYLVTGVIVLPNLNLFRAIAAILVVIFHVPLFSKMAKIPYYNDMPIFHRGTEAVVFFFCLSGFLITHIMSKEIDRNGKVGVKCFYIKRILRIYPLYYLVIIIGLILYHIVLPAYSIGINASSLTNYSISTILLYFVLMVPNLVPCYLPGVFGILWSIGIEEQFYFFWPHIVNIFKDNLRSATLFLFITCFSTTFFTELGRTFIYPKSMWFHLFAIGAFFSTIDLRLDSNNIFIKVGFSKYIQYILLIFMFAFILTDVFCFKESWKNHLFQGVFFSYFICAFSTNNRRIFSYAKGVFDYLGKISYGIYMYHAIVLNCVGGIFIIYFSRYMKNEFIIISFMNITTIFMTILVSGISYAIYERAFLDKSKALASDFAVEIQGKDAPEIQVDLTPKGQPLTRGKSNEPESNKEEAAA